MLHPKHRPWHSHKHWQKLNHGHKTMLVLMIFQTIRFQKFTTSEIWMDTTWQVKWETSSTVVHAILFPLFRLQSQDLNWSTVRISHCPPNTCSLATTSLKGAKVAGPWWTDILQKMLLWWMKSAQNTLEQLREVHALVLHNANQQQESKKAIS